MIGSQRDEDDQDEALGHGTNVCLHLDLKQIVFIEKSIKHGLKHQRAATNAHAWAREIQ
jgi:hypothetical protein